MLLKANFRNIEFYSAASGNEAIEIIRENLMNSAELFFNFIFMDLNMNCKDGY